LGNTEDIHSDEKYVLIAEDDVDDQDMLIEALKELKPNWTYRVAGTGSKAITALEEASLGKAPCLIVLDYNLPELSGAEILAKLQTMKAFKKVAKVVWSTSGSPVYEKRCYDLGADHYAVKPIGMAEMKKIAGKMIELCEQVNKDRSE
jgi:CheY-like chemotaxis protein